MRVLVTVVVCVTVWLGVPVLGLGDALAVTEELWLREGVEVVER